MVSGFLLGVSDERLPLILGAVCQGLSHEQAVSVLILAPFTTETWKVAASIGTDFEKLYWSMVSPSLLKQDEDAPIAIEWLLNAERPRAAFNCARYCLERIPPKLLFRLMSSIPTAQEDGYQLEPYYIAQALKYLSECGVFSVDEMATLEFLYLDALERRHGKIPNLEVQLERHPELFIQAVAFAYKRRDDGLDPEPILARNEQEEANRARLGNRLLDMVTRIPGHDEKGQLNSHNLIVWINAVRKGCADLARAEVGDIHIGQLLAKAPVGSDEVWPIEAVRDAIEESYSESLAEGVHVELFNSRGVHARALDEGGGQERELAAKYQGWARALEFTHPNVAKILKSMVRTYERHADWEDTEERVRRRLLR